MLTLVALAITFLVGFTVGFVALYLLICLGYNQAVDLADRTYYQ